MKQLWYKKTSRVHGSGLFAVQNIKRGSKIIEYIGDKVTKKEGDKRADKQIKQYKKNKNNGMVYIFQLNKQYDIDGAVSYNHAKLINHSCNPNCEVEIVNNENSLILIGNPTATNVEGEIIFSNRNNNDIIKNIVKKKKIEYFRPILF